ncbi:DNA repair protein RecO [bacterium Unc6]|nr:DNA repair protein RecO [bacterium Unc6]
MDRIKKATGIVIKYYPFKETSRIATILTKESGKIRAVAKGYHRKKSNFGSTLEPLTCINFVFYENPKKDYFLISQADIIKRYENIRNNYEKLICGSIILDMTDKALHLGQGGFYDITNNTILSLEKYNNLFGICVGYQIKLLSLCGFAPKLKNCIRCGKTTEVKAGFSPAGGGTVCENCLSYFKDIIYVPVGAFALLNSLLRMDYQQIQRIKVHWTLQRFALNIIERFWLFHFENLPKMWNETVKIIS